jgi:hypothetical protein
MTLLYHDKNWLYEQYHIDMLSATEISKIANVKKPTILRWMDRLGLKRRSNVEGMKLSFEQGKVGLVRESGENHHFYGRSLPEEVKKKISDSLKGEKNWKWKGKRIHTNGYIWIKREDHPNRTRDGYVFEHRLVMEQHIGRYLTEDEVVHHINGDKTDNDISNLHLFATQKDHAYFHRMEIFNRKLPLHYSY